MPNPRRFCVYLCGFSHCRPWRLSFNLASLTWRGHRYDYWAIGDSSDLHPIGHCKKNGIILQHPKGYGDNFEWDTYLQQIGAIGVPDVLLPGSGPGARAGDLPKEEGADAVAEPALARTKAGSLLMDARMSVGMPGRMLTEAFPEDVAMLGSDKDDGSLCQGKFTRASQRLGGFETGMRLEAVDRKNPALTAVAHIAEIR